ncbi:hypothetical protein IG631_13202 [Alternaria alternata]|nr:hypothetical protein IG631_13202 [Alternaria alternata]
MIDRLATPGWRSTTHEHSCVLRAIRVQSLLLRNLQDSDPRHALHRLASRARPSLFTSRRSARFIPLPAQASRITLCPFPPHELHQTACSTQNVQERLPWTRALPEA